MSPFRFAGDIYKGADKALGGLLPGGGTPNPVIQIIRNPAAAVHSARQVVNRVTQAKNPVRQVAVEATRAVSPVIRRPAVKAARDVVLGAVEPFIGGVPARTFAQAMTGGTASGGPIRQLDPNTLSQVKRAVVEDWRPSNVIPSQSIQYNLYNEPLLENLRRSAAYSGDYSEIDNLKAAKNTLGSFGAVQGPGGVVIKDTWKVDEPYKEETYAVYPDLKEGGKLATDIYRFARDAGIYRPMEYNVKVPYDEWDNIEAPRSDSIRRF